MNVKGKQLMSEFKFYSGNYSKFLVDKQRYETWDEAVSDRVMGMHRLKFKDVKGIEPYLNEVEEAYKQKLFLGSQRALQFGFADEKQGILKHNSKMYNCLTSYADRPVFFQEAMYWLLSGCGIGFRIFERDIKNYKHLTTRSRGVKTFEIEDSIEGWSDAIGVLIASYLSKKNKLEPYFKKYQGYRIDFDFSKVRERGSLISGGFKAPGPEGLRNAIIKIENLIEARNQDNRQLRTIDVYDIIMHMSDAVLSGGVRRSATICLFEKTDELMLNAKTGNWFADNPQRARSNNSVLLLRDEITKEEFDHLFKSIKDWGEPGFVFVDDYDIIVNPCLTGDSVIETDKGYKTIKELAGMSDEDLRKYKVLTLNEDTLDKEYKSINTAFKTSMNENILKIEFNDGTEIKCTPDHKIYTINRDWVEAKDLKSDDIILSRDFDMSIVSESFENTDNKPSTNWRTVPMTPDGEKPWNVLKHDFDVSDETLNEMLDFSDKYKKLTTLKEKNKAINSLSKNTIEEIKNIYEVQGYGYKVIGRKFNLTYTITRNLLNKLGVDTRNGMNVVTDALKKFRSERVQGDKNPWSYIDNTDHMSISGYYMKNDGSFVYLRSSYEYAFALYLDSQKLDWGVEDKVLTKEINGVKYTYRPDFFVYNEDGEIEKIYEIKGKYLDNANLEKAKLFDNVEIVYDPYTLLDRKYGDILYEWKEICKNKPKKIASISELKDKQDVYDLSVDGNKNFYANGTLVHNCVEIGMYPKTEDGRSGWQGCNLTEQNGGKCTDKETFFKSCRAAAIMGTLQAAYTDFDYVDKTSPAKEIFEREALLGCSITGFTNNPDILLDPEILEEGAKILKQVNREVAEIIGINPAARLGCVKPSGNASVLLKTASGCHGEHSKRYFRNVQVNKDEDLAKYLKEKNPEMFEESVWSQNNTDWVCSFPVVTDEGSIYKKDLLGVKQLEIVKLIQKHWVETSTNYDRCLNPVARHNVSNTINVENWDETRDFIYENRKWFAGVSLLANSGDKDYAQAPFTSVLTSTEIFGKYGECAMFASGLIVDGLHAFNSNLWGACDAVLFNTPFDENSDTVLKKDWVRRFKKFGDNFLGGDYRKTANLLKDVYLLHKWNKINLTLEDIDWKNSGVQPTYTNIDTTGAMACSGGACEINF